MFAITEDDEITLDNGDGDNKDVAGESGDRYHQLSRSRSLSHPVEDILVEVETMNVDGGGKEHNTRPAIFIITTVALIILVLAAALVTTTFLMSPIIEQIFGQFS